MQPRPPFGAALAIAACIAAGCGGGSSNVPIIGPSPGQPTAAATTVPLSSTDSLHALPAIQGIVAGIVIPANDAPAGALLEVDESISLPAGVGALALAHAESNRVVTSAVPSGAVPIVYFTFVSPVAVTLQRLPSFTVTLSSPQPAASYGAALFVPNGGWTVVGNIAVDGATLTFTGSTTPIALSAGTRYTVLLYRLPAASPSPSPSPSATPIATATPGPTATPVPTATPKPTATPIPTATPNPTATPAPTATPTASPTPVPTATPPPAYVLSPSSVQFTAAGQTAQIQITSPTAASGLSVEQASTSNAAVATVSAPYGQGCPTCAAVTVTSVAAGTATITIRASDGSASSATASIQVATTTITPQSHRRSGGSR